MKFNSYIPTKLNEIVDLIWEQKIPTNGKFTVLPSGKIELLFPLYRQVEVSAKNISFEENPVKNHACFLSGLHTRPLKMAFDQFHTIGIQMKPTAVKTFFGIPLCEIRDYFVEGKIILSHIQMMEDIVHGPGTFLEKAKWIEHFLLKQIHETPELHQAIKLNKTIQTLLAQKKDSSYKTIEELMGYSRTHTYRIFNEWFGTSAHTYQKLVQFIQTMETLHNPSFKLNAVGLANGYYDQSHFIRSFQEFSEMTPGAYRKQMSDVPGQLFT